MKSVCLFLIRAYQGILGPLLGGNCRFYPSCSHYAVEAIERHGVRHGSWLAMRRLLRCHPFSSGGVDLVPESPECASTPCAPARGAGCDQPEEEFAR